MKKNNKYLYHTVIQGLYDVDYGWDDVTIYDSNDPEQMKSFRSDWKSYCENEPQYPHRVIHRRVPNPDYIPPCQN